MVTKYRFRPEAEQYQALSALFLSESAVVIDVRHCPTTDRPLLAYLHTELADLEVEMRHHHVAGWSKLLDCITLLRLDALSTSTPVSMTTNFFTTHATVASQPDQRQQVPLSEMTEFIVTPQAGKPISCMGSDSLTKYLCDSFIDAVRDARLHAMKAYSQDNTENAIAMSTIRPTSVRVFFLADMQEPDSLVRAATYAHWLKEWTEKTHGTRPPNRDERLQTIIVSLNTDAAQYQDTLLQTIGTLPDTATDTLILLQTYSDNDERIDEEEQIYHADLLLYTLLLHWPDVFLSSIEDPVEMHTQYVQNSRFFPWPTYIIGIAAMEYSARWAARWLDFGIADQLLTEFNDTQVAENASQAIKYQMQQWMKQWWQEMQRVLPETLMPDVDELQAFAHMQEVMRPSKLLTSTPQTVRTALEVLRQNVGELYIGNETNYLRFALKKGPDACLQQWAWASKRPASAGQEHDDELAERYESLQRLSNEAKQWITPHFQGIEGALPGALKQLAALAEPIAMIQAVKSQTPDLLKYHNEFEQQVYTAENTLTKKYPLWQLPIFGLVQRTTALCVLFVLVFGVVLLVGINWSQLLHSTMGLSSSTLLTPILWLWKGFLLLLLVGCAWAYLAEQRKQFRLDCRCIQKQLSQLTEAHITQIKTVIAAHMALAFLQAAGLYDPKSQTSPYEQRLREGEQRLRKCQAQARQQHEQAHTRLQYVIDGQKSRSVAVARAPILPTLFLHNRDETIQWKLVEDALLLVYKELKSNGATFNLLTEMLLRHLGKERPSELLDSMLQNKRWLTGTASEMRFQALDTLFVALTLLSPLGDIEPADVFPLLQQYTELKDLYQQDEETGPGSVSPELSQIVQEMLLKQVQQHSTQTRPRVVEPQPEILVLTSWIERQRRMVPAFAQLFSPNDVLTRMEESAMQPSEKIDTLSKQGTLLGKPDELSGENSFYLFFAPGETSEMFLQANESLQRVRIRLAAIPDHEKLVYLHIHRIRQLFPASAQNEKK